MPATPLWSRVRLLAALLVVPVLLLGPIIAAGQVLLPFLPALHEPLATENPAAGAAARGDVHATMGDRVYPFLVDQHAARAELSAGHLPTWEPRQTLGMPLFGGNVAALGYPLNWLAFVVPPEHAAAPLALLALFLAGLGLWLFLTRLELDPRAALIGAIGLQVGGFGLANLYYYMKVDSALWLPWALWAVEGLARRRRWSATALALSIALAFLGGMVSIAVFVVGATGLYALHRLGPWSRLADPAKERGSKDGNATWASIRRVSFAGLVLVLGIAGSAYWTLPVAESARASLRGGQSIESCVASSLPPTSALGVLVPDLAGPPDDPTPSADLPLVWWLTPGSMSARAENGNVLEWNSYALVALALLAWVGVVADPRRAAFPGALLLGCFAFAQGWPVVRGLYALPGLDLGAPQRILAVAWVLWPWLASLGASALLSRSPRALSTLLLGGLLVSLGLLHAWRTLDPIAWAEELESTIMARYPGYGHAEIESRLPLAGRLAAAEHLAESLVRAGCAAFALLLAGLGVLLLDRRAPRFEEGPPPVALLAGVGLPLAFGLLPFALSDSFSVRGPQALLGLSAVLALSALVLRVERRDLVLWLPFAALLLLEGFLGSYRHVHGRSVLTEGLFPPSATVEAIREAVGDGRVLRLDETPDLADSQALARPNMLIPYGIADLTPYPTFTPRQAAELAARIDPRMLRRNHVAPLPALELIDHPLLDLMRAQCLLSRTPRTHPRLAPILERPGFCIYRRLGALSAARIVPAARVGASDEAILDELAAPGADYTSVTLVAPEDGAHLQAFTAGPDWAPGRIAALERPAGNRVVVRVEDSRGGWLVLHEQWAEGWSVRVNGATAALLRADHYCRAVALPIGGGETTVEFEYSPATLEWGAVVALVALLGLFGWELLNRPD